MCASLCVRDGAFVALQGTLCLTRTLARSHEDHSRSFTGHYEKYDARRSHRAARKVDSIVQDQRHRRTRRSRGCATDVVQRACCHCSSHEVCGCPSAPPGDSRLSFGCKDRGEGHLHRPCQVRRGQYERRGKQIAMSSRRTIHEKKHMQSFEQSALTYASEEAAGDSAARMAARAASYMPRLRCSSTGRSMTPENVSPKDCHSGRST